MTSEPNAFIVVPAYNEGESLAEVLHSIAATGHDIVVVDDGSRDNTAEVAARAGICVLRHPLNLGQGAALQTGIDFALRRGAQQIVTFDADGQHDPAAIAALLAPILAGEADFTLGSRSRGAAIGIPPARRAFLRIATWFTRWHTGLPLTDTHNGLRAMSRRGALAISLTQNRMAHASQILGQIARSRLPVREIPVTLRYTERSLAKGQRLSGAFRILLDMFMEGLRP